MKKFGIASNKPQLKSYDPWLHMIPPFFICVAFCTIWCQRKIERRIEKRELAIRIEAEGKSQDMARYFKKKQDKFDRLEYLTDLYKLIKENLDEINDQIAENDRRTREEDHDNMEKMLKDKHSILRELRKGKGDTNLNDIKSGLMLMLSNLRFWDGRSLEEMYNEAMKQERLEAEEARLEEIDRQIQINIHSDTEDSEEHAVEANNEDEDNRQSPKDEAAETKSSLAEGIVNDPILYDDLLKAKQQISHKREDFYLSLDSTLTVEEKEAIMNRYDEQMAKLDREMVKEQEDQANTLKAKLAQRLKMAK